MKTLSKSWAIKFTLQYELLFYIISFSYLWYEGNDAVFLISDDVFWILLIWGPSKSNGNVSGVVLLPPVAQSFPASLYKAKVMIGANQNNLSSTEK